MFFYLFRPSSEVAREGRIVSSGARLIVTVIVIIKFHLVYMVEIESSKLTLDIIPGPHASWKEIFDFALTFDGYKRYGSIQNLEQIASEERYNIIDELRASPFYIQRVWHGLDEIPEGKYLYKFKLLVEAIREKVAEAEIKGATGY